MLASTVIVTLRGPHKTLDMELPGDILVGELLPFLLIICGYAKDDARAFHRLGARLQVAGLAGILSSDKTLIDANVCDGMVLVLQTADSPLDESLAPQPSVPTSLQPGIATGGIGVNWVALT